MREKNGIFVCDDAVSFLTNSFLNKSTDLYSYGTSNDVDIFGDKFVTDKDLGDIHLWREDGLPSEYKRFGIGQKLSRNYFSKDVKVYDNAESYSFDVGNAVKVSDFCKCYVISDTSDTTPYTSREETVSYKENTTFSNKPVLAYEAAS